MTCPRSRHYKVAQVHEAAKPPIRTFNDEGRIGIFDEYPANEIMTRLMHCKAGSLVTQHMVAAWMLRQNMVRATGKTRYYQPIYHWRVP